MDIDSYKRGMEAGMRLQKRIDNACHHSRRRREHHVMETILMEAQDNLHSACTEKCVWHKVIMANLDVLFENFFIRVDSELNSEVS